MNTRSYGNSLCSAWTSHYLVEGTLIGHIFEHIAIQVISSNPKFRVVELLPEKREGEKKTELFGNVVDKVILTYSDDVQANDWAVWPTISGDWAHVLHSTTFPLVDVLMPGCFQAC